MVDSLLNDQEVKNNERPCELDAATPCVPRVIILASLILLVATKRTVQRRKHSILANLGVLLFQMTCVVSVRYKTESRRLYSLQQARRIATLSPGLNQPDFQRELQ